MIFAKSWGRGFLNNNRRRKMKPDPSERSLRQNRTFQKLRIPLGGAPNGREPQSRSQEGDDPFKEKKTGSYKLASTQTCPGSGKGPKGDRKSKAKSLRASRTTKKKSVEKQK